MAELRELGGGLQARRSCLELALVLPDGAPGLVFSRVDGLVRVRLQLAGGKIGADVTFQPGVVGRQLDQAARELAVDPNRWRLAVLAELRWWSDTLDWCPQQPGALTAAVGALGHPLLHHVYRLGHSALGELPRWAVPVLRAADPAGAAAVVDPAATRRLARSLAASLIARPAPSPVELSPLSFAVVGAGLVNVDELANLLEVPVPDVPLRLPMGEDIRAARHLLERWPVSRRSALLTDAAANADVVQLSGVLRQLDWVWDRMPLPLPVRWAELNEVRLRLVPITGAPPSQRPPSNAPAHSPATAATAVRDAPAQSPAQVRQRAAIEQPRGAPVVPAAERACAPNRWPVPVPLQTIHHARIDNLRFVVPTSALELRRWGLAMHNCLADYAPAAATGRSWIIGIERNEALIGCIEIDPPARAIRQLLGPRNRPLANDVAPTVRAALNAIGVAHN